MNSRYREKKNNLIFFIVTSLFLLIASLALYVYESEKDHMYNNEKILLETEIELLGEFLSDSMLRRDYSQVKNYLQSWIKQKDNTRHLEVIFENGFKLFSYKKKCKNEIILKKTFSVANKQYTIILSHSITKLKEHIKKIARALTLFVLLFTSIVGFILWFILSRWILKPLQDEIDNKTHNINLKQKQLEKINRSYQALSGCNIALLEAKNEQELLEMVCNIIYEKMDYKLVWIGYAQTDKDKSVKLMAYDGEDKGYLKNVDISWSNCEKGNGPTGKSIREKRTIVTNNTQKDPYFEPWRDNAKKRGFYSTAGIPIIFKDNVFGAINVYSEYVDAFLEEEINLLKELASNLAFGIVSLRQHKEIEKTAITDGLTNIFNRRYFDRKFLEIVNLSKRDNIMVSFLMIDVDFFKQYNDNYGHQEGDRVLQAIAKLLDKLTKRATDYCFRLGGEEFGIISLPSSKENALFFAEMIRQAVSELKIEHKYSQVSEYITVSMGLVSYNAKEIKDIQQVYKQADNLLYDAKKQGRNKLISN